MRPLKREYAGGDQDVVVYLDKEEGTYLIAQGNASGEGVTPFFTRIMAGKDTRDLDIVHSFYGINREGIRALRTAIGQSFSRGITDIEPSDLEEEVCEPVAI
ncbi:MAG: hypothetical protein ACP5NS_04495 [Candidatus Pacearchaeota archaeon]